MSRNSDDLVEKLIESAADGTDIDWDEIDQLVADPDLHRLIQHLRVVAGVADLHRSHLDDVGAPPASSTQATASPKPTTRAESPPPGEARRAVIRELRDPGVPESVGQWGHLRLVRKIGEGAFGEVYHAHDTWLDHAVALKLLKKDRLRPDLSTRILHEARKLARIRHPNVVTVHGADNHDGRVGFWMDLVEGRTLADLVALGRFSPGESVHIGQELCLALAAVHNTGLVHRDVKAQNVMRATDGGRIILMDFGAGEFIGQADGGPRIGTPLYLAPELLSGGAAGVRSDIYALGVLLFFLVTGAFPVQGASVSEIAGAHTTGRRRRLRDVRPDLPDFFVNVVERAVASDPTRRYLSAGEMHAALAGEPTSNAVVAPEAHARAAAWHTSRGSPGAGAAVGWILASLLALTLVGFITSTGYYAAIGVVGSFRQESFVSWPLWGFRAMFPGAVLVVALMSVGFIAATALYRMMAFALPRQVEPVAAAVNAAARRVREADPATTAPVLFALQGALLVSTWWWFHPLIAGLDSLIAQTPGVDLTPLSPANVPDQRLYRQVFSLEFYALALGWAALVRSKIRRRDPGGWVGIAGGVTLTTFTLILLVIPYRILSHNDHQRVQFLSQTCYLVAERGNEGLLFCPRQEPPRNRVVRLDALNREGPIENVFSVWGGR